MRVSTSDLQQSSINTVLDQQSNLLQIQNQLGTGRRILSPSDDPSGATQALNLDKAVKTSEQYQRNNEQAELRLRLEDTVLDETSNVVNRIRELTVQGANASQNQESRQAIAAEMRERVDELQDLANTDDGRGEYLFSGYKTDIEPFVREGEGVQYRGDQGQRDTQVGPSRKIDSSHSGYETFMDIPTGNGDFQVAVNEDNQGRARLANEEVIDDSIDFNGPYEILFEEDADGDMQFEVVDGDGDPALDANGDPVAGAYQDGAPIEFDGRSVTFEGEPEDGDSFAVDSAPRQSLFQTVDNLIDAFESRADDGADRAKLETEIYEALENMDSALGSLNQTRAETGARLNALESELRANEAARLDLETELSRVEDLNYAEAISRFQQQQAGLQAAQQSYSQIQNLSLFNYI
ncbi:flagellar hook-associated protein FlgL [Aquisalimonas sp.]|uniref:flagellar hook-associated protein FlgL n=1 Tax=unclassified Aquisalimonas TaxID=2644645 RepID=UPI0025BA4D04|nr:flagellar hook-associated protein FlgL [Aquisalimonas sp.]